MDGYGGTGMELYRYNKLGARMVLYDYRLELITGVLWAKKHHVIPLGAITGLSVEGGGHLLIVQTAGRRYELAAGVRAADKLRAKILPALGGAPR
jgi:hypothetical protein